MRARRLLFLLFLFVALGALPGCRGCSTGGGQARGDAGADLSTGVPVNLDGKDLPPIDRALLDRTPPDFTEGERRAWKLGTLLGADAARPGTVVEVEDGEGLKTVLATIGEIKDGREVVFAVNRVGEARVALILPAEPFPSFHGRGGNRGRGGDPMRIREARKIWLRRSAAP